TGPKAGGPQYVRRFIKGDVVEKPAGEGKAVGARKVQKLIDQLAKLDVPAAEGRQQALSPFFGEVPAPLDLGYEEMPGPTGEQNHLSCHARGVVLCLGPDTDTAVEQAGVALSQGNKVVVVAPGAEKALARAVHAGLPVVACDGLLEPEALTQLDGYEAVVSVAEKPLLKQYREALAVRDGALLPVITEHTLDQRYVIERHLCIDTTAAGGNASLIASAE
ncbi:MAG: bifunctional proline dehydrogenase/L-glutamate gamma-semialdehyde dehydrogenase, partial [Gammaproteobacteria bacterium]|nr:bifunctional proline dehydrogenase/L-glutamate gamma-semialdehyde dehydrogenase [Gammaproteobacteria bacterium]